MERNQKIDIIKGMLILFVVIGHYAADRVHDIIFLFHMPLFFMISGFLLKGEHLVEKGYIVNKIHTLIIPYLLYLFIDLFFIRRDYSLGSIVRTLWGGRAVPGVYWYITCFLFALFLLSMMIRYLSDKMVKTLIFCGGGVLQLSNRT